MAKSKQIHEGPSQYFGQKGTLIGIYGALKRFKHREIPLGTVFVAHVARPAKQRFIQRFWTVIGYWALKKAGWQRITP